MELDDKVCYCFHVPKRKIVNFIRIHQPKRASLVSECGGAGTGCGWCIPFIKRYFAEAMNAEDAESDELSPDEYARRRSEYIHSGKGTPPPGATPPLPLD